MISRNVLLTLTQLKSFSNYFYKEQHLKLICCKFKKGRIIWFIKSKFSMKQACFDISFAK